MFVIQNSGNKVRRPKVQASKVNAERVKRIKRVEKAMFFFSTGTESLI